MAREYMASVVYEDKNDVKVRRGRRRESYSNLVMLSRGLGAGRHHTERRRRHSMLARAPIGKRDLSEPTAVQDSSRRGSGPLHGT